MQLGNGLSSFWYMTWLELGKICELVDYVHMSNVDAKVKDAWRNGGWDLSGFATPLLAWLRERIMEVLFHQNTNDDGWVWMGASSGSYSIANAYR